MARRKGRIKPTELKAAGRIPSPGPLPEPKLAFSFKYLELNRQKFSLARVGAEHFRKLLERLKALCQHSWQEVATNKPMRKQLHVHPIDFSTTTEKSGFSDTPASPPGFSHGDACLAPLFVGLRTRKDPHELAHG